MAFRGSGNEPKPKIRPDGPSLAGSQDTSLPVGSPVIPGDCAPVGVQTDIAGVPVGVTSPTADLKLLYDWTDLTDICPDGLDPRNINKVMYKLVALHFVDTDCVADPILKKYTFTNDPVTSKLRIAYASRFDVAGGEKFPAVIVRRMPHQTQRIVIGDLSDRLDGDAELGTKRYVRVIQGGHRFTCVSSNDGEAEALGQELFELFHVVQEPLRTLLPFQDFQPVSLSEVSVMSEDASKYMVNVDVSYVYEYGWLTTSNAPVMSSLRMDMDVHL